MKESIRRLAIKYFLEVRNSDFQEETIDEELAVMADNFVKDIERTLSARKDFKEE